MSKAALSPRHNGSPQRKMMVRRVRLPLVSVCIIVSFVLVRFYLELQWLSRVSHDESTWTTHNAVGLSINGAVQPSSQDPTDGVTHLVFSTSCSISQDWQSIALFVSARDVNQQGYVTRIASGCNDEQAKLIRDFHAKTIAVLNPNFLLHLTPDYSKVIPGKDYKYFNKPFGMKHWLENAMGYNFDDFGLNENNPHNGDLIVLVDPDQMLMRPFTRDMTGKGVTYHARKVRVNETTAIYNSTPMYTRVSRGHPMAQMYAFGSRWVPRVNWTYVIGNDASPAAQVTEQEYNDYHSSGPPYLAVGYDMARIVDGWTRYVGRVHDMTTSILSEMYGYLVSSAHHGLPHQMVYSFMVSGTGIESEGWQFMDTLTTIDQADPNRLPFVLHYCLRYYVGPFFFNKYKMPRDLLTCDHAMLAEPPVNVTDYTTSIAATGKVYNLKDPDRKQASFFLYHLLRKINRAVAHFKSIHCEGGNYEKTYLLMQMT
jgi:peptidyl serine alpha-galactosyltransferase